ncbi:GntR family transcriptional regulator [Clostridium gelidum]|uniref:GntR family transcriptional regulator n=1 Tax=Clostridium gelidum TaxID=704125 RepID=A0ABN6IZS4_9CLOT|nr:GntR family transcriptional regulator [Clostridium gelidum]BCZ46216.1 GntR family transcriptional regulator [Clostridium gelidum]
MLMKVGSMVKKIDFIVDDIMNKITQKKYTPGEKILTERELAEKYSVSRHTVREALKKLESIGYIYKIQGSGIFISDSIHYNALIYNSLTQKKFSDINSKVLYFKETIADHELAEMFNIEYMSKLWGFKRIRIADSQKVQIETSLMPKELFPKLTAKTVEKSIHDYVQSCNYKISHFITEYRSINISKEDAELLDCKKGTAVTKIKNRGYLKNGIVFEITESLNLDYSCCYINDYNSDMHKYRQFDKYK